MTRKMIKNILQYAIDEKRLWDCNVVFINSICLVIFVLIFNIFSAIWLKNIKMFNIDLLLSDNCRKWCKIERDT